MKKNIIIFGFVFFLNIPNLFGDVRDSVEKYKGTTYIGNIFNDYEYIPEPINEHHKFTMLNSIGFINIDNQGIGYYDIGLQYLYRKPRWFNGPIGWGRIEYGGYSKILVDKNVIVTFGITFLGRFDSPFYFGESMGIMLGSFEYIQPDYTYPNDSDSSKTITLDGLGLEVELFFGYDIKIEEWIFSPELKFCLNFMATTGSDFYLHRQVKSPLQIGFNIGRLY